MADITWAELAEIGDMAYRVNAESQLAGLIRALQAMPQDLFDALMVEALLCCDAGYVIALTVLVWSMVSPSMRAQYRDLYPSIAAEYEKFWSAA